MVLTRLARLARGRSSPGGGSAGRRRPAAQNVGSVTAVAPYLVAAANDISPASVRAGPLADVAREIGGQPGLAASPLGRGREWADPLTG